MGRKYAVILVPGHYLEIKIVCFSEQIISADQYPSIFRAKSGLLFIYVCYKFFLRCRWNFTLLYKPPPQRWFFAKQRENERSKRSGMSLVEAFYKKFGKRYRVVSSRVRRPRKLVWGYRMVFASASKRVISASIFVSTSSDQNCLESSAHGKKRVLSQFPLAVI